MSWPKCTVVVLIVHFVTVAAHAVDVSVHTRRQSSVIVVEATADFTGRMEQAWNVLTDYDHLAQFIPNMKSSRIIERGSSGPLIEQKGVARLLLFDFPLEVKLVVTEFPPYRILSRGAGGSFKTFRGEYNLSIVEGRTRLRYVCEMVPDFFFPPILGTAMLRHNVEESFSALADEIVRRSATPSAVPRTSTGAAHAR